MITNENEINESKWRDKFFMEKKKKKPLLPKSSLIIRLVAGMYLIYLAYELAMGLREVTTDAAPLGVSVGAIIVFAICGMVLSIASGKAFLKGEFQGGIMDVSEEKEKEGLE